MMKFCTGVAQYNTISHAKSSEIDNDVIPLNIKGFCRKALNFKRLYLSPL